MWCKITDQKPRSNGYYKIRVKGPGSAEFLETVFWYNKWLRWWWWECPKDGEWKKIRLDGDPFEWLHEESE